MRTVYLDYNATTPLDPAVREAILHCFDQVWGNPSSVHHVGRSARAALDEARERLASSLRCKPAEIIFTSGGTEANNLAVLGVARKRCAQGRHLVVSAVEHHAVLHPCEYLARKEGFRVSVVPVDPEGRVHPDRVIEAVTPDTVLVAVMAANNEVGTLQPVAEIGARCRERGIAFHTDAVQWFGKEPFSGVHQFNADLVALCGHKFCGPKGVGALFIRAGTLPEPILFGGGHENELRAGTENLAAIVGLIEAFERCVPTRACGSDRVARLKSTLEKRVRAVPGVRIWSPPEGALANTLSFTVAGCDSLTLLAGLDLEGICCSSGAACSAGSLTPSHVLTAMGASREEANGLVRMSLGGGTSAEDVEDAASAVERVVNRVSNCGAGWEQHRTRGE